VLLLYSIVILRTAASTVLLLYSVVILRTAASTVLLLYFHIKSYFESKPNSHQSTPETLFVVKLVVI